MIWLAILLIFISVTNLIICMRCEEPSVRTFFCYVTLIFSMVLSLIIGSHIKADPLDVYRGKTELKITEERVNGVVTKRDSVVIYKNR